MYHVTHMRYSMFTCYDCNNCRYFDAESDGKPNRMAAAAFSGAQVPKGGSCWLWHLYMLMTVCTACTVALVALPCRTAVGTAASWLLMTASVGLLRFQQTNAHPWDQVRAGHRNSGPDLVGLALKQFTGMHHFHSFSCVHSCHVMCRGDQGVCDHAAPAPAREGRVSEVWLDVRV
jgi:hypothetical protein